MHPEIIDPTPKKLPPMDSIKEAAALNQKEKTTFYVSAYLFQCWISKISLDAHAQLAEQPFAKDRTFQKGHAWRGFKHLFGKAGDDEFPIIFRHLMEFAQYDDPLAQIFLDAAVPMSIEHDVTGELIGKRTPPELRRDPKRLLALMRAHVLRLCDWLDSICQLRTFVQWYFMPDFFDADPQKRELAFLAYNKRNFDDLSQESQLHFLGHLADLAPELKRTPKWQVYQRISSGSLSPAKPWPSQALDCSIIKLWPLLKRYRWSAADLLYVLRKILQPDELSCVTDESALANHCSSALSLHSPLLKSHFRAKPEPRACEVGIRCCAPPKPADNLAA